MKKYFFVVYSLIFIFYASFSYADCRGCCSGHGGADCIDGVTQCKDGTPLSDNCLKKCDKCSIGENGFTTASVSPSTSSPRLKIIAGNTWNDSFSQAKKTLERRIYSDHQITFYCKCPFDDEKQIAASRNYSPKKIGERSERVEWEHIVPAAHFGQSFEEWRDGHPDCVDNRGREFKGRNCAGKISQKYRYMESDMYNLVPAVGEINGLRSNFRFDMIAGESRDFGACDMEIDSESRIAEPPTHVRGDIARTYQYMHLAYPGHGIISSSSVKLFNAWSKQDPIDGWECERSRRIERIQGNANQIVKTACLESGLW